MIKVTSHSGQSLQEFKQSLAASIYGITREEAHQGSICIDCKQVVDPSTMALLDRKEYQISAICPKCWDKLFNR